MFDQRSMAMGGFYPGLVTTLSVATLGTFDVEVIIEPVYSGGGGGYIPLPRNVKPERYRVTVKVYHNGQVYQESVIVDDTQARVYAKMNGIEQFSEYETMVSFNGVQVIKSNPTFNITKY